MFHLNFSHFKLVHLGGEILLLNLIFFALEYGFLNGEFMVEIQNGQQSATGNAFNYFLKLRIDLLG